MAPHPPARRLISPVKAPATEPPALAGAWAPDDDRLDAADLFPVPASEGPEDVVIDGDGRLVTGTDDGQLWRWPAGAEPGTRPERFAHTGGRPLGIEVDPRDGSLVVCDGYRGLLRVTGDGQVAELARTAAGTPIGVCNNAAVARDGTVFFSDSSSRYPLWAWRRDLLEYRPSGRLLAYRPGGGVDEVARDLYFPNGVALTPDESAVLVVETSTHRLLRVPLAGGGPVELADLPAYPDNMSPVGDGTYWIALPSPRVRALERLLPYPAVRRLAAVLPERVQPGPLPYTLVALVDGEGRVLRTLHGPDGRYPMLTGVRQHGDSLWLGSLTARAVARVPISG
ncbi:MAG TPA: SMP-30/gluconolactonase/LRE family protein [Rugosimonospora sp.]|nr:SMP-30/gluconolactonase/LRE family protein [Rugosimonospora sp.]